MPKQGLSEISDAKKRIGRAIEVSHGLLMVSFSGGKDSIVSLALAAETLAEYKAAEPEKYKDARLEAFFMYLVSGLESVERPIRAACEKYNVHLEMLPHWDKARMVINGVMCPRTIQTENLKPLKINDIENWMRMKRGLSWVISGHRASDSLERRGMLTKCQGFDYKAKRVYPIWDWRERDVYAYMNHNKIPMPPRIGPDDAKSTGVDLRYTTLIWFREKDPDGFRKILKEFPYADSIIYREEMRERKKNGNPEK